MWWSFGKKQKCDAWVRKIIKKLPLIFPRTDGHAWKFPKMHLQKHIPANIDIYGAPLNFDCTNGEKALQQFAKDLSKTVAKNTLIKDFNHNLAIHLQQQQIQLRYINEYSMTDSPFIKIIRDMNRNRINQRDQKQDWCWDNTLLNNNTNTMNNSTPSYVDHEKKVFLSKSPDWSAHYTIKFF